MAASNFSANNAAEFQTVDLLLTGIPQDITSLFDFTSVPRFDLAVEEDQVPLGLVASIIDPLDGDLSLGPVSSPIYVRFSNGTNTPPIAVDDAVTTDADTSYNGNVLAHNTNGPDYDPDFGDFLSISAVNGTLGIGQLTTLNSGATLIVNGDGSFVYDPNDAFNDLLNGVTATDHFEYTLSDGDDMNSALVTVTLIGVGGISNTRLLVADDVADESFSYDTSGTLQSSQSFEPGNDESRGVAAAEDGSAYWVVDVDKKIYVYDSDNSLLHQWQFSGFSAPEGIGVSGLDLWVVSKLSDEVYYFAGGANYTEGAHAPTSSFSLDVLNNAPQGMTTDGSNIWVVNDASAAWKVFKYSTAGSLLGSWGLDAENRNARGITVDPNSPSDLLVINGGNQDVVYRYANARDTISGSLAAAATLPLTTANSSPSGLAAFAISSSSSADFDADGDIDGADFLAWQRGFGLANAKRIDGDADDDGDVDGADVAEWEATYGQGLGRLAANLQWSTPVGEIESLAFSADPTAAELIDTAIAIGLLETTTDEEEVPAFENQGPLFVASVPSNSSASAVTLSVRKHEEFDAISSNASSSPTEASTERWLSDELLEQVFG